MFVEQSNRLPGFLALIQPLKALGLETLNTLLATADEVIE
jgi:hypothetical protein